MMGELCLNTENELDTVKCEQAKLINDAKVKEESLHEKYQSEINYARRLSK